MNTEPRSAKKNPSRNDIANLSASLSPAELVAELRRRGVKIEDAAVLRGKQTCPHCDHTGTIEKDFGVRILRGELKPQSWCRECRANPGRKIAKRRSH